SFAGARTRFKKVKRAAQLARERQQKRNSAGHKRALRTGISAMAAGNMRRAAENSGARLADRHQKKVEEARQEVLTARAALSVQSKIKVDLGSTLVSATRRMIEAAGLNYRYAGSSSTLWSEPLEFLVSGPERIHLKGVNGSGKSTLIDLICGRKHPTEGFIRIANAGIGLLDQKVDVLDDSLSVLDNLKRTTKDRADFELRILLGRFLFYHDAALKPAGVLSGGERMRAGLACLLGADRAPEILILDEPTNNLDL